MMKKVCATMRPNPSKNFARPTPAPLNTSSRSLFGEANELQIEHRGETYRLRITRQDKLILTK